ncbi:MAG: hypothetical protein JWO79_330 [Actinomycetia bacterium]|nr:hypothetical protein [Actinomycetes bacterium]
MPAQQFSRRKALALGAAVAGMTALRATAPARAAAPTAPVQRFYLGTYTSGGGRGIAKGHLDPASGSLTVDRWLTGIPEASWLELDAARKNLYAISELTPGGTISALRIGAGGDPSPLGSVATGAGPAHVAIAPGGRYAISSLYGGGGLAVNPIRVDGTVGPAVDVRSHGGPSHAHQVVADPSGAYLLAVDLGLDAVIVYTLAQGTGKLTEVSRTAFPAGSGPRHLAFHPTRPIAYLASENSSTVTVCKFAAGRLTAGQVRSTVASASGLNYPGEVAVAPSGRYVYVTNRGQNSIATFAVSPDGASLTFAGAPSCGGNWPRHLAIDSTGAWIYAVNQRSGDVSWFPLSPTTGLPGARAGSLPAAGAAVLRLA